MENGPQNGGNGCFLPVVYLILLQIRLGKFGTLNQNSANVWFLAGTSGGYEEKCSIPEGIAILISPIEVICTFAEYPELKTEDDLRNCAKSDQDAVKDVS